MENSEMILCYEMGSDSESGLKQLLCPKMARVFLLSQRATFDDLFWGDMWLAAICAPWNKTPNLFFKEETDF